jgi:hypothetical protein
MKPGRLTEKMNRFATVQDLDAIASLRLWMFHEIGTADQLTDDFPAKPVQPFSNRR